MAYVRTQGRQLAIVHGERDPRDQAVRQRTLFTIYSMPEALEALGRGPGRWSLSGLLEAQYPQIRLDWKKVEKGIEEQMQILPDIYPYEAAGIAERFHAHLVGFARELFLSDPQELLTAAEVIEANRSSLEVLAELIAWRTKLANPKPSEWNGDNAFLWRYRVRGASVPMDAEEWLDGLFERREHHKVKALASLLVACFPNYADGHNYLGLIALDAGKYAAAAAHFRKTAEVGRTLFPTRFAKRNYWTDHATRPFMRGLRNLALTLNRAGTFEEALIVCDRLVDECGDTEAADATRMNVFINARRFKDALETVTRLGDGDPAPEFAFQIAIAHFELGHRDEAAVGFLRAARNFPRAANMLFGQERGGKPSSRDDVNDHNTGVAVANDLNVYLHAKESGTGRKFFRALLSTSR